MPPVEWPLPISPVHLATVPPRERRDGSSPLEQAALARIRRCAASLTPTDLVRIAIWPETIRDLASDAGLDASYVHNVLAGRKRGPRVRDAVAARLRLTRADLDHVLETPRAPIPPAEAPQGVRDGRSPLEVLVARRADENVAAFPAGFLLNLVGWPFCQADLAKELGAADPQPLYNLLNGVSRNPGDLLPRTARFLGVEPEVLEHVIRVPAAEAVPLPTR